MPYQANLIPIDESHFRRVLLPAAMGEKSVLKEFDQLQAEAIRIRQVQLRTHVWKRRLMHMLASGKPNSRQIDHIEMQVGGSGNSNSNRRQGAAQGFESPPAVSMVGNECSRGIWDGTDADDSHVACRGVLSRPFFIATALAERYQLYRNAQPNQVDQLAESVMSSLADLSSLFNEDNAGARSNRWFDATPASEEVVRHEVTWKFELLRNACQSLGRLRAVFDSDGEVYHPHQIISAESPMILLEFAANLHPGWTIDGPWNPSNLLPKDGLDGRGLFESTQSLFAELTKVAPALGRNLNGGINSPYSVGAYIPSGKTGHLHDAMQRQLDEMASTSKNTFASQQHHALTMWSEAASYALAHGFGLVETADLYNLKDGVLN